MVVSAARIAEAVELYDQYGTEWLESPQRAHNPFTQTNHSRAYRTRSLAYQRTPVSFFHAQLTVLRPAEDPADRMTPLASAITRVWSPRASQVVTLASDTSARFEVHLAGVAPHASRHVAGTMSLRLYGDRLGPAVEWCCPLMVGSSTLGAYPVHWPLPRMLYLRTRIVAGPTNRPKGLPPTN